MASRMSDGQVVIVISLLVAVGFFGLAAIFFAVDVLAWLKAGIWNPTTITDVYAYFDAKPSYTSWLGINQVLQWIYKEDASSSLFLVGGAFSLVAGLGMKIDDDRRRGRS